MSLGGINPAIAGAIDNDRLELIVNPTERCNLRCRYCYESFSLGKMSTDVSEAVIKLVERRANDGLKNLKLEFFGGEPLTAWDVVERIAGGIHVICKSHEIVLSAGMTTNAVLLTRERLNRLVQKDVRLFQVTVDGPEDIHDQRRVGPSGESSFATVIGALQMMKKSPHELHVTVRLHFDPISLDRMLGRDGFVAEIVENLAAGDPRFNLHFHALGRWGGPNDLSTSQFASAAETRTAICRLEGAALAAGLPKEQILHYGGEGVPGESGHFVCYAARANAFVIRSDGAVSKCTVALDDERNLVGRLSQDGELIIDHQRHLPWMRGLISGDETELSCPAFGFVSKMSAF